LASECANGCPPNPTFDQLDREERSNNTNFSTLNARANFDYIRVCEAFDTP